MANHLFGAIELALVFGCAIVWGLWELRETRRARHELERREAAAQRMAGEDATPRK